MKKNGFTVVEVIVSFVLVTTISVFLFQLVLLLRNLYNNSDVKTELLNKQATLSNLIYESLNNKEIDKIAKVDENSIMFTYNDNSSETLNVDKSNKLITFGNYTTSLNENSNFGQVSFDIITINDNKILKIKAEILNEKFENKDFGLNIIYQFKNGELTLTGF